MLPNDWQIQTIKDTVALLEVGASVNSEDRPKRDDEVGVLKVSAVSYGTFDPTAYKTVLPAERKRLSINPKKDTVIVSRANTSTLVGASAYIEQDYADIFLPDKLWQITTKETYSARWLSYILILPEIRTAISDRATGTSASMKNISQNSFLSVQIPVPPLVEQRKIAAILGTWDAAIATVEQLIATLQVRKQGLMQRLLTGEVRFPEFAGSEWDEVQFSDVLNIEIGGTPSRNNPQYWDVSKSTDNRWLSIANLKGKYISDSSEYLSDLGVKKSSSVLFPAGTVVMSFKLTIGRAAILTKPCYTNEAICGLFPRSKEVLLPQYLYHALGVVDLEQEIDQAVKGRTLNKDKLKRLRLLLPCIAEQKRIAQCLDLVDQQQDAMKYQRELLQVQKQALMQQLLTGQVRVNVADEPILTS